MKRGILVIEDDNDPELLKLLRERERSSAPSIPWDSVKEKYLGKPKRKCASGKRRHTSRPRTR